MGRSKSFEERARAEVERIKAEQQAEDERLEERMEELRKDARARQQAREEEQRARGAQQSCLA
jgi:hypothetical protein